MRLAALPSTQLSSAASPALLLDVSATENGAITEAMMRRQEEDQARRHRDEEDEEVEGDGSEDF